MRKEGYKENKRETTERRIWGKNGREKEEGTRKERRKIVTAEERI